MSTAERMVSLRDIVDQFDLEVLSGGDRLDRQVRHGYASDLMSDVIAGAQAGDVWVTLQTHVNVAAVAVMKQLAGVILIGGRRPEEQTLAKAKDEGIPLMVSSLPAFELIGRLYGLGISGRPKKD